MHMTPPGPISSHISNTCHWWFRARGALQHSAERDALAPKTTEGTTNDMCVVMCDEIGSGGDIYVRCVSDGDARGQVEENDDRRPRSSLTSSPSTGAPTFPRLASPASSPLPPHAHLYPSLPHRTNLRLFVCFLVAFIVWGNRISLR